MKAWDWCPMPWRTGPWSSLQSGLAICPTCPKVRPRRRYVSPAGGERRAVGREGATPRMPRFGSEGPRRGTAYDFCPPRLPTARDFQPPLGRRARFGDKGGPYRARFSAVIVRGRGPLGPEIARGGQVPEDGPSAPGCKKGPVRANGRARSGRGALAPFLGVATS